MSAPLPIPADVWSLAGWVEREVEVGRVARLVPELLERVGAAFDAAGSSKRYSGAWPATTVERDTLRAELFGKAVDALGALADLDARWTGAHAAPTDPSGPVDSRGGRVTTDSAPATGLSPGRPA